MAEDKPKSNFFQLDSNIDGVYLDSNGDEQTIENMIQVVGATDGSKSYPPISGGVHDQFPDEDIAKTDDLTEQRGNRGHGLLFDENGKVYAQKGDLVLRDANTQSSLTNIVNKVKSILETKSNDVMLLDSSLEEVLRTKRGITLDDLILKAETNQSPFGLGNIIQATRNEKYHDISVNTFTVPLTDRNTVWVLAHVIVKGEGAVQLRDVSSDTILSTSYAKAENGSDLTPVYISFVGNLDPTGVLNDDCCININRAIYSSFYKRFFKKDDVPSNMHEIAVEMIKEDDDEEGNPIIESFSHATVNVLVMDDLPLENVFTGVQLINKSKEAVVTFDRPMSDTNYAISVQSENAIGYWYNKKTPTGFTINFEREYSGQVFYTAIGDTASDNA